MSHTNQTANYGLPQWIGTDSPAWLGDMNPAFVTIDTNVKSANDNANSALNTTITLSQRVTADESNISTNSENIATLQGDILQTQGNITAIETLNGNTSLSGIGDGTLTGGLSTVNEKVVDGVLNGANISLPVSGWVSSQIDARYPLSQQIAVTGKFTAPNFSLYNAGGLSTATQDATFALIPKCVYDNVANTITFYSTASASSDLSDIVVRVLG